MTTIFFCGDPHGEFHHIVDAVKRERPDAVILLGDMELRLPLHVELAGILELTDIWWIPGNHDTDSEHCHDNLFLSTLADRNLHRRIVEIAGLRIAGLGGVFRSKIWDGSHTPAHPSPDAYLAVCGKGNRWRGGLPLKHRSTIFPAEIDALMHEQADILVTHEAPPPHPFGFTPLAALATQLGVKAAFHGHHHDAIAYADGIWHGVAFRDIYRYQI
jgi:predicted phosphodiesterase